MNYECELDKAWLVLHDIFYRCFKDLTGRTAADKVLRDKALNPSLGGFIRDLFSRHPLPPPPSTPHPPPLSKTSYNYARNLIFGS